MDGQGVTPDTAVGSLREKKKARTRDALIEVSQRLFSEQGYGPTTLEQICAEVGITTPTLLRYFESKAHLALEPLAGPLRELGEAMADPRRTLGALDMWRAYLTREAAEAARPSSPTTVRYLANLRDHLHWVDKDAALVAMTSDLERRVRDALAAGLAIDAGLASTDLHSALLAAVLVTGRRGVWDRWLERELAARPLLDDQLAVVDYAVSSLPREDARRLLAIPGNGRAST